VSIQVRQNPDIIIILQEMYQFLLLLGHLSGHTVKARIRHQQQAVVQQVLSINFMKVRFSYQLLGDPV
jgi:hypothetical protein